jgi:hypothetical protein
MSRSTAIGAARSHDPVAHLGINHTSCGCLGGQRRVAKILQASQGRFGCN